MHIPDGFLAVNTWAPTWLISIGGLGYCVKKASRILRERAIPLMGVMAAFIFVAQMLNFPVMGGTSGHLIGSVLAAVLLGPYAAAVVIAVVLIAQCLIFQDGGLTSLGANILNMSLMGSLGGYLIYNIIRRFVSGFKGMIAGAAVASWASVVIAACACAVELAISGTTPLSVAFPAMAFVHAVIGIAEALITCMILAFIFKVRPDLIYDGQARSIGKIGIVFALAVILILLVLSRFASKLPDGLERVLK
ncbi:MAG: energy-coupling factor ABC transporter permease [Candidatus Omnitrophota bacterium]|nr:energy-coupling factor ABC transporter permease [Candidatus Omnitrophota bacterium]